MKKFDFKKYVEFKVYSVTTIKKGYGFRVLLKFADGSDTTQQHAGSAASGRQMHREMKSSGSFMQELTLYMERLK